MEERARSDLESIYGALGKELAAAGSLTIAVIVLFPHLRSVKSLGFPIAA